MKVDINKFSFPQLVSNSNGKTSGSGFCGVYIVVLSMLTFIYGCYEFHISGKADIMMYASANIIVGSGLLGYRKSIDKNNVRANSENAKEEQAPQV